MGTLIFNDLNFTSHKELVKPSGHVHWKEGARPGCWMTTHVPPFWQICSPPWQGFRYWHSSPVYSAGHLQQRCLDWI